MSVSLTNAEAKLLGNGSTTAWSLDFELADEDHLEVTRWESDGTSVALVVNVDYTVRDLNTELGATIDYPLAGAPLPSGAYLYARRMTPRTQETTGSITNELDFSQITAQFDRIAFQLQELSAELERAIRMSVQASDPFGPLANGVFGTDAQGRPTLLTDVALDVTVVSGVIIWETGSVVDLVNDTDLGYSGGATVQVSVGDLLRAGGYNYEVVSASSTLFDVETAGGVRAVSLDSISEAFPVGLSAFFDRAKTLGYGLIVAGTHALDSLVVSAVDKLTLFGSAKALLSKIAGSPNILSFYSPQGLSISDLGLDGNYDTLGDDGHGLVLRDADDTIISNLRTTDFGGLNSGNGGAGLLAYPNDGTTPLDRNIFLANKFTGAGSEKDFGMILASARYNVVLGNITQLMTNYGLEFKNNADHNVMAASVGYSCRYSFGTGYEGAAYSNHNVFGLLASRDSDIGFIWAHAKNSVLVGLQVDAEAQPDTFGDGNCYGLHIEQDSNENLAVGVAVSGSIVDYPLRIRGLRNAVVLADYSDAAKSITFNDTAQENYVNLLHIGDKATSVIGLIDDQAPSPVKKGAGVNVVDSPMTRQYIGSLNDAFTWYMDGLGNAYTWFSTTSFRFEGHDGQTILGLGVKDTKEAGLRISTAALGDEAAFTYNDSASQGYWRMDMDGTQKLRFDVQAISPTVDQGAGLGKNLFRFGTIFGTELRLSPTSAPTLNNGDLTIVKVSDTSVQIRMKGSDGVTRNATLTLS